MSGKTKTMKTKDGRTIPIIEPENKFIKRRPTKKEMQEEKARNRASRNITGDREKQRKTSQSTEKNNDSPFDHAKSSSLLAPQ